MNDNKKKPGKVCCPPFDPDLWNEKEFTWKDKMFIKDTIPQVFHMPVPGAFSKATERMWEMIEKADAQPEMEDFIMLAYDPSPWKSELYINVTKAVPDADNVKISGDFMAKVYDGPLNAVPKWMKDMQEYVEGGGRKVKKFYVYYTTCPGCAEKREHNYVVVFAEVR